MSESYLRVGSIEIGPIHPQGRALCPLQMRLTVHLYFVLFLSLSLHLHSLFLTSLFSNLFILPCIFLSLLTSFFSSLHLPSSPSFTCRSLSLRLSSSSRSLHACALHSHRPLIYILSNLRNIGKFSERREK